MEQYNFSDFVIELIRYINEKWVNYVMMYDVDLSLSIKDEKFAGIPVVFKMANYLFWDRRQNYKLEEGYLRYERYPAYIVLSLESAQLYEMHYLNFALWSATKRNNNKVVFKNYYYYNLNIGCDIYAVKYNILEEVMVNILNDVRRGNFFFAIRYPTPENKIHIKLNTKDFINYTFEEMKQNTIFNKSLSLTAFYVPLFAESISRNALTNKLNSITINGLTPEGYEIFTI